MNQPDDAFESRLNALWNRRAADAVLATRPPDPLALAAVFDDPASVDRLVRAAPDMYSWQDAANSNITISVVNTPISAVDIAARCGSCKFLAAYRERCGSFGGDRLALLLKRAAEFWAWDVAKWLLCDKANRRDVETAVSSGTLTVAYIAPRNTMTWGFTKSHWARLRSLLGVLRPFLVNPLPRDIFHSENGRPIVIEFDSTLAKTLVVKYGYGPTPETAEMFFELLWDGWSASVFLPSYWLDAFLASPALGAHKAAIVRRYRTLMEEKIKDENVLFDFVALKIYQPRASLIDGALCFNWLSQEIPVPADYTDQVAESVYMILWLALSRFPGSATARHLVTVLALVTPGNPERPANLGQALAGCRSLIKMLLYHEADHLDGIVRRHLDRNRDGAVYKGLAKDVYEVAAWRKWIAGGHIGGLPPELAENVMYSVWKP